MSRISRKQARKQASKQAPSSSSTKVAQSLFGLQSLFLLFSPPDINWMMDDPIMKHINKYHTYEKKVKKFIGRGSAEVFHSNEKWMKSLQIWGFGDYQLVEYKCKMKGILWIGSLKLYKGKEFLGVVPPIILIVFSGTSYR
jgi:hypothetical protein